jgi:hypothetical protein
VVQIIAAVISAAAASASALAARASWRAVREASALHRRQMLREQREYLVAVETHLRRLRSMALEEAAFGTPEYLDRRLALIGALAGCAVDLPRTRVLASFDGRPNTEQWTAAVEEVDAAMIAWPRLEPSPVEVREVVARVREPDHLR